MNPFALIPGWDGLHPLVVDFVIVSFVLAPLFLLVSLFAKQSARTWAGAALLTLALGTLAAWLATGTGHAAATLITRSRGLAGPVSQHEAMGLLTRNLVTVLTVLFAAVLLGPGIAKKAMPRRLDLALRVVLLVFISGSALVLTQTAYRGARLVHEFGVQAVLPAPPEAKAAPASAPNVAPETTPTTPPPAVESPAEDAAKASAQP